MSLDKAYAELPAAGENVRDLTPRGTSLANSPRRKVGRSINDPGRTAERLGRLARSTGNLEMQMGLMQRADGLGQRGIDRAFSADQAALNRDFTMRRDATNFAQSKEMRGLDQAFSADQAEKGRLHDVGMYGLAAGERAMTHDRASAEAELERERGGIDRVFMMPTEDGTGAVPVVQDKGGRARVAGGFYPTREQGQELTPEQIAEHISQNMSRGISAVHGPSGWTYTPLRPQTEDGGSETTTLMPDAEGNMQPTQVQKRVPLGGAKRGGKSYF